MSHNIVDGMISFNAETPWHGLGTRVNPQSTPEEMLAAANMNWEVELRSLAVSCTVTDSATGKEKNAWCHQPMTGFKAVMRKDTGEVFAVPTKKYHPVQNIEVARFFHDFADATSCELQVVGALEGGRKVWALAKVAADYVVTGKRSSAFIETGDVKDEQLGYVMLATSHDGSLRTVAMGTSIYVVCWNTMSAALASAKVGKRNQAKDVFALRHTAKFDNDRKREAAQVVSLVKAQQASTAVMAEMFASFQVDAKGRIEFLSRLLRGESVVDQIVNDQAAISSGSLLDAIAADAEAAKEKPIEETRLGKALIDAIVNGPGQDLPSRQGTAWGLLNGVTYYVDHERGRTRDSGLSQAWFGQGAELKAQAVDVLYDMTGAKRLTA